MATFNRQNLDFILFEVLNIETLAQHAFFSAHSRETFGFTLDVATEIAQKIMQPAYADSDRNPPQLIDRQVKVHPAVHQFVKAYAEAGLIAAPFPTEFGGSQLPKTVAAAAEFILGSAHNSLIMFTDLVKGVANLICTFGSEVQKAMFLPKFFTGECLGTMCLTETQAGSSLSDIATTATQQPDGTFKIKGQKIFISAGDHDVSEKIIHLVLARIEGAPKGTKGISLFIVPKQDNDVTSVGIYHKMGQKTTPAMHLEFGANDRCTGYLLGEANRGLPQMFLMMNGARLGVGNGGIQIASAAYQASLRYAQKRPQGRRLHEKNALAEPATIIHHPDVRRMLFLQKTIVEGGLCLILQCFLYLDLEKSLQKSDAAAARRFSELLELLTPVAKTYGAEMGAVAVNQGLQVLGGYGYTEDFELEQMARDVRIMSLYEGTTGIQAQALLGRQVLGNGGRTLKLWQKTVAGDLEQAKNFETLKPYLSQLNKAICQFLKITDHLILLSEKGSPEATLADANLYLEAFGLLNVGWQWIKQGMAAEKSHAAAGGSVYPIFYQSKIQTLRFYFHYEMPRLEGLFQRLGDGVVLTVFDEKAEMLM